MTHYFPKLKGLTLLDWHGSNLDMEWPGNSKTATAFTKMHKPKEQLGRDINNSLTYKIMLIFEKINGCY